jgi:hypothetical protein
LSRVAPVFGFRNVVYVVNHKILSVLDKRLGTGRSQTLLESGPGHRGDLEDADGS